MPWIPGDLPRSPRPSAGAKNSWPWPTGKPCAQKMAWGACGGYTRAAAKALGAKCWENAGENWENEKIFGAEEIMNRSNQQTVGLWTDHSWLGEGEGWMSCLTTQNNTGTSGASGRSRQDVGWSGQLLAQQLAKRKHGCIRRWSDDGKRGYVCGPKMQSYRLVTWSGMETIWNNQIYFEKANHL